jgi:hypothetical protein
MKKGPIVHVEFYDHAQDDGDVALAKIDLYGILVKEDKRAYYIASWIADNIVDHNTDCYAVLKHKGLRIRRLK